MIKNCMGLHQLRGTIGLAKVGNQWDSSGRFDRKVGARRDLEGRSMVQQWMLEMEVRHSYPQG
jgi:hypothetical protein